jgi:hypothetical protein
VGPFRICAEPGFADPGTLGHPLVMMGSMNTSASITDHPVEQLTLLPVASTPARFRLSKETRERGLRHVAEIRQMLAARATADMPAGLAVHHDRAA